MESISRSVVPLAMFVYFLTETENQLNFRNNLILYYVVLRDTRGAPAPAFSGKEGKI